MLPSQKRIFFQLIIICLLVISSSSSLTSTNGNFFQLTYSSDENPDDSHEDSVSPIIDSTFFQCSGKDDCHHVVEAMDKNKIKKIAVSDEEDLKTIQEKRKIWKKQAAPKKKSPGLL